MEVEPRRKLTAGIARKLQPRVTATLQPTDVQETEKIVTGKGTIRFALQLAPTSKWKRRLNKHTKRNQADSSMWKEVEDKWQVHQEASKKRAVRQEVEQIRRS